MSPPPRLLEATPYKIESYNMNLAMAFLAKVTFVYNS